LLFKLPRIPEQANLRSKSDRLRAIASGRVQKPESRKKDFVIVRVAASTIVRDLEP
jgi:hypothetical protein